MDRQYQRHHTVMEDLQDTQISAEEDDSRTEVEEEADTPMVMVEVDTTVEGIFRAEAEAAQAVDLSTEVEAVDHHTVVDQAVVSPGREEEDPPLVVEADPEVEEDLPRVDPTGDTLHLRQPLVSSDSPSNRTLRTMRSTRIQRITPSGLNIPWPR